MSKLKNHQNTEQGAPGAAKKSGKKGQWRVIINPEMCKGCNICIEFCPTDVFEISETLNRKGYYVPLVAKEGECTGCRICDLMCPELAIIIEVKSGPEDSK